MNRKCLYSRFLGKIVLLFATAQLFAAPSLAQDLQVMVVGPWSYVSANNRLFLVVPGTSTSHKVYLLPGTSALPPYKGYEIGKGSYTLNLVNPGNYIAPANLITPVLSPATLQPTSVTQTVNNASNNNYVISLPTPSAYSTSPTMGTSESEVSPYPIPDPSQIQPQQYTTWMILYYPHADGLSDQSNNLYPNGASIVLTDYGSTGDDNDQLCDHVSLESVQERNSLWHIQQYARFPEKATRSKPICV